ncbi:MAG: TonB-dependent receptor [Candidatus Omnitrophota bacterium]|nr:MAG: TonB-dependent receptor [Candidatus Omnitrophota bacterium]
MLKKFVLLFGFCFLAAGICAAQERVDLGQIVVTPTKMEQEYGQSTQQVSVIGEDDIKSSGQIQIADVLDLAPSVDIWDQGLAGAVKSPHIRGSTAEQVLVLMDGRPLNTPRDGFTDLNKISLANIERIEILRGAASTMYGSSAVGGAINVITKRGSEDMPTQLSTKFGSFATKNVKFSHGDKIDNFDYFISYEYLASHGHRDNSDYLANIINTKIGYTFNPDHDLVLSAGYYNGETGSPGPITFQDLDDQRETFDRYFDLTYKGKFSEHQDLTVKFFHNRDRLEFIETFNPLDKSSHTAKVYGVDGYYVHRFNDTLRTTLGGTYQDDKINSTQTGNHSYNFKGIYFDSELALSERASLQGGVRWDNYSHFGDRVSPRGGLIVWLSDTIQFHSSYGSSYRAPTFNELYWPEGMWAGGNPNLKPELAWSVDGGFAAYPVEGLKVDLTVFKTRFEDLIQWVPDAFFVWRPMNVSSAVTEGFEIEADYEFNDKLNSYFSYTYLAAKDLSTKKWLVRRSRHHYKMGLLYKPSDEWELGFNAAYRTKVFEDVNNINPLKHYFVMDLHMAYNIIDSIQISFDIKNLFDRIYEEADNYPLAGRAFYGGVKINF